MKIFKALPGKDNEITGRLDSRFSGAAFTATFNNYVRTNLGFEKI